MTRWITRSDAVLAALLCSFGSVLLLGGLSFPFGVEVVAVVMFVLAVVVVTGHLETPMPIGWALLAASLVLLIANPVGEFLSTVLMDILHVAGGALVLALGVMKLVGPRPKAKRVTPGGGGWRPSIPRPGRSSTDE